MQSPPTQWNEHQRLLIDRGYDPMKLGEIAMGYFLGACSKGEVEVVRAYLECGLALEGRLRVTPIIVASQRNHVPVISLLIEAGADIEARTDLGFTPLLSAIGGGHREALSTLLDAGANVDVVDNTGCSALGFAANRGRGDLVDMLLEAGANPNFGAIHLRSPLFFARNDTATFEKLLRGGADPNCFIALTEQTVLMIEAFFGRQETAALLLEAGADVGRMNRFGWDAWMCASDNDQHGLAQWLVRSHGAVERDMRFTALFKAGIADGDIARLEAYLVAGGDPNACTVKGWTLLMHAAASDQLPALSLLLEAGADLNALNAAGESALTAAASFGRRTMVEHLLRIGAQVDQRPGWSSALLAAAKDGRHEIVARLLDSGASVDSIDADAMTPVMFAAARNDIETLDRLLVRGANLDLATPKGETALMRAARNHHLDSVRRLVEGGADLERRSNSEALGFDATVLHQVCSDREPNPVGPQIIEVLLEGGADPSALNKGRRTPIDIARHHGLTDCVAVFVDFLTFRPLTALQAKHDLPPDRLPLNLYPEFCEHQTTLSVLEWLRTARSQLVVNMLETGLHERLEPLPYRHLLIEAAEIRGFKVVEALLKAGADPNTPDASGTVALTWAARHGELEVISMLLDAGAHPDGAASINSYSPLCAAARNDHLHSMQRLFNAGATINLAPAGNSPLYWAAHGGSARAVAWLLARGAAVEVRNSQRQTALHAAAENGFVDIVNMLLQARAFVDPADEDGETPLFKAHARGHAETIEVLLAAGAHEGSLNDAGSNASSRS